MGHAGVTGTRNMLTLCDPGPWLRERFEADRLTTGDLEQHAVLPCWARARRLRRAGLGLPAGIPTDAAVARAARHEQAAALMVQATDELEAAFAQLQGRGFAMVLADHDGIVLMSRGAELLGTKTGVLQGASLAEADFGTNGVGTALAEQRPVAVLGTAHYYPEVQQFCCYAAPIRDGVGRIAAVLDVTGPADAADPLVGAVVVSLALALESAFRLQQLEQHGGLRVGTLSHDLRNPIHAIRIGAEILARNSDPGVARIASRMLSSANRMREMVGELLDFTRESAGEIALNRRPVDVFALCREVLDELRLVHPDRTLTLESAGDTQGLCDGDRLMRVVQNLVGNAVVHGQAGTPVAVTISAHGDWLTLEVTNEGPPIPAELRGRLFDPFRRGRSGGEGLGLGLYIARSIVAAHGGSITVDSEDDLTCFRVRLPRFRLS
jgi:signal transduction histidine kinase